MGFRVADLAFKLVPEVLADKECESLSAGENKKADEELIPRCDYNTAKKGGGGNCVVHSPESDPTKSEQLPELRLQLAHTLEMLEQVH